MKHEPDFNYYYDEKPLQPGDTLEEPLFDATGQRHGKWIVISCQKYKKNSWCGYRMEITPMQDEANDGKALI